MKKNNQSICPYYRTRLCLVEDSSDYIHCPFYRKLLDEERFLKSIGMDLSNLEDLVLLNFNEIFTRLRV